MITLKSTQYDSVKTFFSEIPEALWHLESMKNRNIGAVIVDDYPNT